MSKRRNLVVVIVLLTVVLLSTTFIVLNRNKNLLENNKFITLEKEKDLNSVIVMNKKLSKEEGKQVYELLMAMELREVIKPEYTIAGGMNISIQLSTKESPISVTFMSDMVNINGQFFEITNEKIKEEEKTAAVIRNITFNT